MKKMIIVLILAFLLIPHGVRAKTIIDMGSFKLTAYCSCQECSEGYGRKTATPRVYARSEHTIAVDPDVISLGSTVKIGDKTYKAEDVGGKVVGDHIDIFFDTHEEVEDFGVKHKNVYIIRK
jgi:3D (Asp-Asp-Asp) domain-containing protein